MSATTVVIASNRKIIRTTCRRLLQEEKEVRVIGEARSGLEAVGHLKLKPRILLLDLNLCLGYGVALLQVLRRRSPRTKMILLTAGPSETGLLDALAHGVRGYVQIQVLRRFLPKAVHAVDAGEAWIPRGMVTKILDFLTRLTPERPNP